MDDNIDCIRKYLKHKIINDSEILGNYENEWQQLYNLIKLTIVNGESQSVLIMGPRGSGKTIMVNSVLKDLNNYIQMNLNTIVIHLNGLIHTDDKLALKSCTIQMNLENAVGYKVFSTFAQNLAFLLECLRVGERSTVKCLLFIIEEFDLFCFHDNQTLLYNLLDMTNYSQIPICVVGITSRLDVVELFEKRVKSRFSHRVINIFPSSELIDGRIIVARQWLSINSKKYSANPVVIKWNKHIAKIINSLKFQNAMKRLYDLSKCERVFKNIIILIISKLNEKCKELKVEDFIEQIVNYENGCKSLILNSLSVLEICLIIAMKHHIDIFDNQPFNFEMIFERYRKFANEYNKALIIPRSVVLKAFEHIKNLELISPVSGTSHRRHAEYEMYNLTLLPKQLEKVLRGGQQYGRLPTEVRQWYDTKLA